MKATIFSNDFNRIINATKVSLVRMKEKGFTDS